MSTGNGTQEVRRPKAQTSAESVPRKTAKDIGQPVQRVTPESQNKTVHEVHGDETSIKTRLQNAAKSVKQTLLPSSKGNDSAKKQVAAKQVATANQQAKKQTTQNKTEKQQTSGQDWSEHYKSAESQIKKSLKKGNNDFSAQLQKIYQGMLKNCIKQSEDEPHKMQKCWQELSTKMQPVFQKMNQSSSHSSEALKKCFESKKNAKHCIQQGVKFGQQSLADATNSIKSYLA